MVYYFSGTGNSKWAAETLASLTGDTAASIPSLSGDGPIAVNAAQEPRTGLVFPVYAWGVPEIVKQFCGRLHMEDGAYAYAVCTCGDEAGDAVRKLKRVFPYAGAWSVSMPNNYIPIYDVDDARLVKSKIAAARDRLTKIADSVMKRETVYDVNAGNAAWLKTAIASPAFNAFAMRTKPFYATDACNGCGLCEKNCPVGAIQMQNGKPVWIKERCTQCLSCIHRCPQRAIEYGKTTKNKGRYYFREDL